MSKKNKPDKKGIVYSTEPNFSFEQDKPVQENLHPSRQKLRVTLDTKHRGGKAVTLVWNFAGKPEDLDEMGRKLKNFCGSGGSVKNGEIILQGDQRTKVVQWCQNNGYPVKSD